MRYQFFSVQGLFLVKDFSANAKHQVHQRWPGPILNNTKHKWCELIILKEHTDPKKLLQISLFLGTIVFVHSHKKP